MLEQHIKEKSKVAEAFVTLTTPTKINPVKQQEIDFYTLLAEIQKNAKKADILIKKHVQKYDWINFKYDGPYIADEKYFMELLQSETRQGVSGYGALKKIEEKDEYTKQRQKTLLKSINASDELVYWLDIAKEFMFLKAWRKDIIFKASRLSEPLFEEIARRLNITPNQAEYLAFEELNKAVAGKITDTLALNKRAEFSAWIYHKGQVTIFTGTSAEKYEKQLLGDKPKTEVSEFSGTTACVGYAKGKVKIINQIEDMKKMQQGDILVSSATNPDLMPAIRKASAIITNEGGLTCHAAIVSRELNIPCVIGTKIATYALNDSDEVEVDAAEGRVKIIKRASNKQ